MSRVFKTISGKIKAPGRTAAVLASLPLIVCLALTGSGAGAADDAYRPPDGYSGQSGFDSYRQSPPPAAGAYQPQAGAPADSYQQPGPPPSQGYGDSYQQAPSGGYGAYNGERNYGGDSTGYGEPYRPPQNSARKIGEARRLYATGAFIGVRRSAPLRRPPAPVPHRYPLWRCFVVRKGTLRGQTGANCRHTSAWIA